MAGHTWALQPGDLLAGYTIVRLLGGGGMGQVYLARHPRLPRHDALKVLYPHLGADPEFRTRFLREAHLAAQLDHPNIVAVHDCGTDNGTMWLAMQHIHGTDAASLLRRHPAGGLAPAQALDILTQTAKGLDEAHRAGMLHRDIKPANLLVTDGWDGESDSQRVLVGDFGIARTTSNSTSLTQTGALLATLPYAAPEVIEGRPADHRADIYSLACTVHELLTGTPPFPRPTAVAVMNAHLTATPPRPSQQRPGLPAALDTVLATAMAKNPAHRYGSCRDFARAVAAAFTQGAGDPAATPPVKRPVARQPAPPATPAAVPTPVPSPQPPAHTLKAQPIASHTPRKRRPTGPVLLGVLALLVTGAVALALTTPWAGNVDRITLAAEGVPLAAGGAHSLALTNKGQVIAWGDNTDGLTNVPPPPAGQTYTAIATGGEYSLALTSGGQVIAWGASSYGRTEVPPLPAGQTYTAITAGSTHSLALTNKGQVIAWGDNTDGLTNVPPPPAGQTYTAIAAGSNHSLALTSDDQVIAWGDNNWGQTNVPPPPAGQTYTAIAAGGNHSLALTSDGHVIAWGLNDANQIKAPPPPAGQTYTTVAAGFNHSLALTNKGQVIAWGAAFPSKTDVPPLPAGQTYTAIAAGGNHSLALTSGGQVIAWGDNDWGQSTVPAGLR